MDGLIGTEGHRGQRANEDRMALCLIGCPIDVNPTESKRKDADSCADLPSLLMFCVANPERHPVNLLPLRRSRGGVESSRVYSSLPIRPMSSRTPFQLASPPSLVAHRPGSA